MLLDLIKINTPLPFDDDYKNDKKEAEFCEVSYEAKGIEYSLGQAPDGKIIFRNECESLDDYNSRCKRTPTRSYVSSIINKYNSSVFRNEVSRSTVSDLYMSLVSNIDDYGNSIDSFMRDVLLDAQIKGTSYIFIDTISTNVEVKSLAQQLSSGSISRLVKVDKESVINYTEVENKLTEAIILFELEEGKIARYMNDNIFIDIIIDNKNTVKSIGTPYAHGFDDIPLVEVEPFDSAQALPISYSQRNIVNILSLLGQELVDGVFSKFILSGVRLPETDTNSSMYKPENKITWSGKRLVVLEDQSAKLDLLGADHGCADSLRSQISLEEDNLYRSSGLQNPNVQPTNISGYALKINSESFFTICSKLKFCIESAENKVMELIANRDGFEYTPVVYSDQYVADDDMAALSSLRDLIALPLPSTFKKLAIKNYINKFYNVSKEDSAKIEQELNGSIN